LSGNLSLSELEGNLPTVLTSLQYIAKLLPAGFAKIAKKVLSFVEHDVFTLDLPKAKSNKVTFSPECVAKVRSLILHSFP